MMEKILILILVTFIPFFELRLSIPLGLLASKVALPFGLTLQGFNLAWPIVFITCVAANIILGPLVYLALNKFVHHLQKYKLFDKFYNKKIRSTQKRIKPYVKRFGLLGVALFIAIPLPGSGSYTGALGAYLLGINYRKFIAANILGVIIAGTAVTLITLASIGLMSLF